MASFKATRLAMFYQECQENDCTDMHDKEQRAKAEEIAYSLVLFFDDIRSLYSDAKSCYEQIEKEEAEAKQIAEAEERRRAVPGELLLTMSDKNIDSPDATIINVYIRPDNSIYSTFGNEEEKKETFPAIKAKKVNLSISSYKAPEAVFTSATVGGITTGGVHYTKGGYQTNQTYTGKGEISVSMCGKEFVLNSVIISDYAKYKFRRDEQFRLLVNDNKILCYKDTSKSNLYEEGIIAAAKKQDLQMMMNAASLANNERKLEYKDCVSIKKLIDRIIKGEFPPTDEELYKTAESYASSTDSAALKRAIETYTSIIDFKDAKQRVDELQIRYRVAKVKEEEKIHNTFVKAVKKTHTFFKVAFLVTNLFFTTLLTLFAYFSWATPDFSITTAIFFTLSAIVSLPGIGKLVLKNKYKFIQKVLRWVIVVLLFLIAVSISF